MNDLSSELMLRVRHRAADAMRRSGSSGLHASAVDMGDLIGGLGPQASQLKGLMGQFAGLMKGFGVIAPMPVRDRARGHQPDPLPAPATDDAIAAAEFAIRRPLPEGLRRLYAEIADGGFGPGDGLFALDRLAAEYVALTSEPAGPQNQPWPANLLPLIDNQPGYDCLDLEYGEVICWDPEEIEGYSDAAWRRSFKVQARTLTAWIEQWLEEPTALERMDAERSEAGERMVLQSIETFGRMSPEARAGHGLPETGWEEAVRQRHRDAGML
jgi:hypothetical protein